MDSTRKFQIRTANREEMDIIVDWAAREGWNPGIHDAEYFYSTDPEGYFVAYLDDEIVGAVSAVAYSSSFGFIGFFMVKPEYRGHRIGIKLGYKALEYLEDCNIGLDGVENKIRNYETYGFKLVYNNIRYQGVAEVSQNSQEIINVDSVPFDTLVEYDNRFFPVTRPEFLSRWIQQPEGASLGIVENDKLVGYGVIRACRNGYKIGPLFADHAGLAKELFLALNSRVPAGSQFYLDIPGVNRDAVALVNEFNMTPVFKTARMYNKSFPDLPVKNIFGITSFELG